jgi:Asp-tRNA(Asn)/Glu-tRNA(Gln) amidotransferase B subunit
MPELPTALAERLKSQYGISEHDINTVMSVDAFIDIGLDGERQTGSIVNYFERVVAEGVDAKTAINWYAVRAHL